MCGLETYFEGPLLSQLKEGDKNYLYYWCGDSINSETQERMNEWLAFEVTTDELNDFLNQTISLRDILSSKSEAFIVLIDNDLLTRDVVHLKATTFSSNVIDKIPRTSKYDPTLAPFC